MAVRAYVLLPAVEVQAVLLTIEVAATVAALRTGDDVDITSWGIVNRDLRGSLAVNVDGSGIVYELLGIVQPVRSHFFEGQSTKVSTLQFRSDTSRSIMIVGANEISLVFCLHNDSLFWEALLIKTGHLR